MGLGRLEYFYLILVKKHSVDSPTDQDHSVKLYYITEYIKNGVYKLERRMNESVNASKYNLYLCNILSINKTIILFL